MVVFAKLHTPFLVVDKVEWWINQKVVKLREREGRGAVVGI